MQDRTRQRKRRPDRRRVVLRGFAAAAVVAAVSLTASVSQADPTSPPDRDGMATPEPAAQVRQVAEPGTTTGRVTVAGTRATAGSRTVCDDGAKWLRIRFTALALYGADTVTVGAAAGGSLTLTARHWPGKAFYTRAFEGSCVTVTPRFADARSGYAVDAYQSGSQPLAAATVTVAAAGDICGTACNQTDDVVRAMNPQAVITAGDNAYEKGSLSEFTNNYHPNWGGFNTIVHPSPGNHEYGTSGAAGYFDYFNGHGVETGARGQGYYSFNVGDWHFVALNSNVAMGAGSAQETWLRNDLAANTKPCTAAYWHHPRFSTGDHGDNSGVSALYTALYDAGADIVVTGHDHSYERFAPARANGTRDAAGIRQFVIGTGGRALYSSRSSSVGPSEVFNNNTFGVGQLTLTATSYTVDFVPVAGRTFTDRVTGTCHNASTSPDFGVTANPAAVSAAAGAGATTAVAVASSGGFAGAVALTTSGLPAGVTASFSAPSVTPPANGTGTSTLTFAAAATAAPGSYPVTVTATSGGITRTATVQLTVTAPGSVVFADDFETDKGWGVDPSGTDGATTGRWERGDPEETVSTYSDQVKQLGTPVSAANCLSTGRAAGAAYGDNDLDGGATSARSPAFAVPAGGATLGLRYNVAHGDNSGPDDHLRVSVVDGTTVTKVWEKVGAAAEVAGSWQRATVDLSGYAGRTVSLLVEAADNGTGSLFEAQVDDIAVTAGGTPVAPRPAY